VQEAEAGRMADLLVVLGTIALTLALLGMIKALEHV
jgi:hypothetical protein